MLAYPVDSKIILVEPFQSRHDCHRLAAAKPIMYRLQKNGQNVDLQILDNKCINTYKIQIKEKWKSTFHLVPPNMHCRNAASRIIQTFKEQFLSILAGVSSTFPNFLWDKLLPQTELTLNLLRQSKIALAISTWEHFNGPFNFDATPLNPLGIPIIIHDKSGIRRSWDFRI